MPAARPLTNPSREVWKARSSATSIFAVSAGRARRLFHSSQISAFCALAACSPCICPRVALRFAWQPTGLTLPFAPQGTCSSPMPNGQGVCAPGRKHFLSFWRQRPPTATFCNKLNAPARFAGTFCFFRIVQKDSYTNVSLIFSNSSRLMSTSRGLLPTDLLTMPRAAISSIRRPARA